MESQNETLIPKKNNWTIIVGVAIALLCCCVLVAAVVLGGPLLNILTSYQGIADAELRTDTMHSIGQSESERGCDNISLVSAQLVSEPEPSEGGSWTELWQISACGETHAYTIVYTPSPAGGTDMHITSGN